jgi:hypothetical protein
MSFDWVLSFILGAIVGRFVYIASISIIREFNSSDYFEAKKKECKQAHEWTKVRQKYSEPFFICKKCYKVSGKEAFLEKEQAIELIKWEEGHNNSTAKAVEICGIPKETIEKAHQAVYKEAEEYQKKGGIITFKRMLEIYKEHGVNLEDIKRTNNDRV